MKEQISFAEFLEIEKKLDIRIGQILGVEPMPKSNKMLKLSVNFGDEDNRTVMTNIGNRIDEPALFLLGRKFPFIVNLEPATIMGVESHAMIMVAENSDGELEFLNGHGCSSGSKLL